MTVQAGHERSPAPDPSPESSPDSSPDRLLSATRGGEKQGAAERITLALFIAVPFLALLAAVPVAWGWGLGWTDLAIAVVMYFVACHGITIGFHRYFTHGSFKANRALRLTLAVAGSLA